MSKVLPPAVIAILVLATACTIADESILVDSVGQDSAIESQPYALDRIIVTRYDSFEAARESVALPDHDGQIMALMRTLGPRADLYALPEGVDPVATVAALAETGEFESVALDYQRVAQAVVNDPFHDRQWHHAKLHTNTAWDYSIGAGITVAVLDTGCAERNDKLNAVSPDGYDFVNNDADATDDAGHGTHVSGIIAQTSDNGIGVAGVAYGATILPIKVLDSAGNGFDSQTIAGINHAVAQGAQVINMSLGWQTDSPALETAVNDAWAAGVFLACAAGNYGVDGAIYPARYDGCVSVGATGTDDRRAPYTNYGAGVDIAAPGGDLTVDDNNDGYADGILQEANEDAPWGYLFRDGTSRSAPQVAAAGAMLMANGATNEQALDCLLSNAQVLHNTVNLGVGLVRPDLALAAYADGTCGQPVAEPPMCLPTGELCAVGSECCSGTCKGNSTCK